MNVLVTVASVAVLVAVAPVALLIGASAILNLIRLARHWDMSKPPSPLLRAKVPGLELDLGEASRETVEALSNMDVQVKQLGAAYFVLLRRVANLERGL